MKNSWLLCTLLLMSSFGGAAVQATSTQSNPSSPPKISQVPTAVDANQAMRTELDELKAKVAIQGQQIEFQKGALDAYAQKKDGWVVPSVTAGCAVLVAFTVGFFALKNQNKQAAQERLLKAVELIMESRSGYQADIRRNNLAVFLDDATKKHLEGIKNDFSGPEFTDLHLSLAQAMSEKATTPAEVLKIWKCVLKEKQFFEKINYSDVNAKP